MDQIPLPRIQKPVRKIRIDSVRVKTLTYRWIKNGMSPKAARDKAEQFLIKEQIDAERKRKAGNAR